VGCLLDALGWTRASLVGHSMGGQAAYLYAAAHPKRVQRLVVIDTGPEAAPEGIERIRKNVEGPAIFATFDEALAQGRRWFPRADEGLLRYRVEHNLEEQPDGSLTWRSSTLRRGEPATRRDHTDDERWDAWKALAVPTLLIHGVDSDILTVPLVARFAEANPDVTVTRIAGAGHSIPIEQPEALARVVEDFLSGR
jgi:pimeloyl-ACP methyl ester carboxylesterase